MEQWQQWSPPCPSNACCWRCDRRRRAACIAWSRPRTARWSGESRWAHKRRRSRPDRRSCPDRAWSQLAGRRASSLQASRPPWAECSPGTPSSSSPMPVVWEGSLRSLPGWVACLRGRTCRVVCYARMGSAGSERGLFGSVTLLTFISLDY